MRIWKPEVYQGKRDMQGYFEGWYYKMVDRSGENTVVFIPGVSFEKDGSAHAFIQVATSSDAASSYLRYPIQTFGFSRKELEVKIGNSIFASNGLSVYAMDEHNWIRADLKFNHIQRWPVKLFSPGAMGYFAFMPFMQCYHGVISMDHEISGIVKINDAEIDMNGGRGYIEKDWGNSFPRYHVWMQTNHFGHDGASLMCSIASVPWLAWQFDGFIAGFLHKGRLYRFATYTGARLADVKLDEGNFTAIIESRRHRLEISAPRTGGIELKAPVSGQMQNRLEESLKASINVTLSDISGQRLVVVFQGTGNNAGLEIAGRIEEFKMLNK